MQSSFAQIESSSETIPEMVGKDFVSPFTTEAKWIFLSGSALTAALLVFEDSVIETTQSEVVEDHPLGRFSKIGDLSGQMYPNGLYALGMLGVGLFTNSEKKTLYLGRSALMVKATLYSVFLTTALKYSVREPRPSNGNERNSFPSGHATTAFAFATVVGAEHDWYWGALAYSLAGLVAFSRMNDNRHYIHDVVAGATIGMSYGLGLYFRKNDTNKKNEPSSPLMEGSLFPLEYDSKLEGIGFLFSKRF